MANRLYVGNLSYQMTEVHLREAFAPHGQVTSASVVMDRETGKSRGFGFVEMATPEQALKATEAMNGALLEGRPLTVNEARERAPRPGGPGSPRPFSGDRPGGFRGGPPAPGAGRSDRGAAPSGDRSQPTWEGGEPARGSDKRRERDRSDREDGGRGGRGGGGGGGRGGW